MTADPPQHKEKKEEIQSQLSRGNATPTLRALGVSIAEQPTSNPEEGCKSPSDLNSTERQNELLSQLFLFLRAEALNQCLPSAETAHHDQYKSQPHELAGLVFVHRN